MKRSSEALQLRTKKQRINVNDAKLNVINHGLITPPATPLKEHKPENGIYSGKKPMLKLIGKENVPPGFSKKELKLIKEADAYDLKHNIASPVAHIEQNTVYTKAKKLFNKTVASFDSLLGREAEIEKIEKFIFENLQDNSNDFLYVSGPPGCGKTQSISVVINKLMDAKIGGNKYELLYDEGAKEIVSIVKINCMRLDNVRELFAEMLFQFGIDAKSIKSYPKYLKLSECVSPKELIELLFSSREFADHNIVVLDELDALLQSSKGASQQLLFDFLVLAKQSNESSKLILIGIANALNLVDKFAPRLKSNGISPQTVSFLPYTVSQIIDIVKRKLASLSLGTPIISLPALTLCAKKTATNTGDLRKVFDILYGSIELLESQTKKKYLANPELSLAQYNALTFDDAPKVTITHVAKVCAANFGGVSSSNRLKQLNLYQCLVLICLAKLEQLKTEQMMMEKSKGPRFGKTVNKTVNITELFKYYKQNTQNTTIPSTLAKTEFSAILSTLQTIGVVNVVNKANHMNITSQTDLSCCGVTLSDLAKFTETKFDILRELLG